MNAGARRKRSPVGPDGLRQPAFRCRTSRAARVAFGFSLALAFGSTAALGGEVTDVRIESTPTEGYYNAEMEGAKAEKIVIAVEFNEAVTVHRAGRVSRHDPAPEGVRGRPGAV